jgi:hypothetical protein
MTTAQAGAERQVREVFIAPVRKAPVVRAGPEECLQWWPYEVGWSKQHVRAPRLPVPRGGSARVCSSTRPSA